ELLQLLVLLPQLVRFVRQVHAPRGHPRVHVPGGRSVQAAAGEQGAGEAPGGGPVSVFDLTALLLAVGLGVRGYVKGLFREGLEAASALAGVLLASRTYRELGDWVTIYTGLPLHVTRPVMYAAVAVSA